MIFFEFFVSAALILLFALGAFWIMVAVPPRFRKSLEYYRSDRSHRRDAADVPRPSDAAQPPSADAR